MLSTVLDSTLCLGKFLRTGLCNSPYRKYSFIVLTLHFLSALHYNEIDQIGSSKFLFILPQSLFVKMNSYGSSLVDMASFSIALALHIYQSSYLSVGLHKQNKL